ncbi:MAG: oxygen-independent coproporphyrinogen III oxidase [Chloroflexi bacterium]|nr:oxygen-independent coproporphyrinogen III oxidase [Chloroflexota bacterium]
MNRTDLLAKYDVPVPRYTSYPTVPYWKDNPTSQQWITALQQTFIKPAAWSMYIHIPFCETLCTFCGCNTFITHNHDNEISYTEAIHKEWAGYLARVPQLATAPIKQIHLGGGTPTFFSAENLKYLLEPIMAQVAIDRDDFEGSIEIGPRLTNDEQLVALRELGFQRISMGVQDYDPEVQRLINRIQPEALTRRITEKARELGFESVNHDLVYGLPAQTVEKIKRSAEITVDMRPERIALYSFAFIPWIKKAHRLFTEDDLPSGAEKRALYETAREIFLDAGYVEMGLDHFALPEDALSRAFKNGRLHRNFMGYTDYRTDVLLGLGVSSISEAPACFHQNEKGLKEYKNRVLADEIPTMRGHLLNEEDQRQREQILQFMTQMQLTLRDEAQAQDARQFLAPMVEDGLVEFEGREMRMTEIGQPFLRNAALALDLRLRHNKPEARIFSKSV